MAEGRPGWVAVREGAEGFSLGTGVETAVQEPADGSLSCRVLGLQAWMMGSA